MSKKRYILISDPSEYKFHKWYSDNCREFSWTDILKIRKIWDAGIESVKKDIKKK